MNNTIVLKRLKEMGLTTNEAKCYLALLGKDVLSVTEVAKIAGITRRNAYENLERLLGKGISISRPGSIKQYSAVSPESLIDKIVSDIDRTTKVLVSDLVQKGEHKKSSLNDLVEELAPVYKKGRSNNAPLEYIEILKDPYQIHRKFVELFSKAEKEVLVFCKPPFSYCTEKEQQEQFQVQNSATRRGVVIRGIFEMPPEDQKEEFFGGHSKEIGNKGDEIRVIAELPIKLNIFDNRTCLFTLEDKIKETNSLTMLVTEHEAMAKTHRLLFESIWEKAQNYYVYEGKKYYMNEYIDDDELPSYRRKFVTKLL